MRALIIVDIQNDFCPGGALAVPEGDAVVPVANDVQRHFELIVATQDWPPPNHASFASSHPGREPGEVIELHGQPQVLWPDHCVQGTTGAELRPDLEVTRVARIVRKGMDPEIDSYSGFYDNDHQTSTGLADYLREHGVDEVYLLGLATDYCVKFTALDAVSEGFRVHLIEDGCRGIDASPGDVDSAIEEMRQSGVEITASWRL